MKRMIITLFIFLAGLLINTSLTYASDSSIYYDLKKCSGSGIEHFKLKENYELIDVIIDERLTLSRMEDKTYTITKSKKGSWLISYKITVKNNKITSVSQGVFKAAKGNFTNTSLKSISNTKAMASGTWHYQSYVTTLKLTALIINKKLVVK